MYDLSNPLTLNTLELEITLIYLYFELYAQIELNFIKKKNLITCET